MMTATTSNSMSANPSLRPCFVGLDRTSEGSVARIALGCLIKGTIGRSHEDFKREKAVETAGVATGQEEPL
jgi:hypothetical protein